MGELNFLSLPFGKNVIKFPDLIV